jgi:hypothetical protein
LKSEAFGVLETTFFGEVESSCPSTSESAAFIPNEEQALSVEGEVQRLIGAL